MPVMSNWSPVCIPDSFTYHPSSVILIPALVILSPAGGGINSAKDLVLPSVVNSAKDLIASWTLKILSLLKDEILHSLRSLRMTRAGVSLPMKRERSWK